MIKKLKKFEGLKVKSDDLVQIKFPEVLKITKIKISEGSNIMSYYLKFINNDGILINQQVQL